MTRRRTELILWSLVLVGVVLAAARWRSAAPHPIRELPIISSSSGALTTFRTESLSAGARTVEENDLFRLERKPASSLYRPDLEGAPPPAPRPPRPMLAVTGILGGPPWEALVEGIPGRDGSVLIRRGDILGDLRVRAIGRDTVTIQGSDTTWKLIVRRAWQ